MFILQAMAFLGTVFGFYPFLRIAVPVLEWLTPFIKPLLELL